MGRVAGHLDPPFAGVRARDRHIIQAFADPVDHFVPALVGLNEIRLISNSLEQRLGIPAEAEEIILFLFTDQRFAIERRFELIFLRLVFRQILFLPGIVPTLVFAEINIAALQQLTHVLLHFRLVPVFRGADKVIVGDAQFLKSILKRLRILIGPLLRRHSVLRGGLDNLGRMLIGAGQEEHIIATEPVIAGHNVGQRGGVDMPDVRAIVHIINRRGDIEFHSRHILAPSRDAVNDGSN